MFLLAVLLACSKTLLAFGSVPPPPGTAALLVRSMFGGGGLNCIPVYVNKPAKGESEGEAAGRIERLWGGILREYCSDDMIAAEERASRASIEGDSSGAVSGQSDPPWQAVADCTFGRAVL